MLAVFKCQVCAGKENRRKPDNKIMKLLGKWKIDSECRVFKQQWTADSFSSSARQRQFLNSAKRQAVIKEFNIRRHYETCHGGQYGSLLGQVMRDKVARLKSGFATQHSTVQCQTQMNLSSIQASFKVAKLIESCGKSFSDRKFVEKFERCRGGGVSGQERCPEHSESVRIYSYQVNWRNLLVWLKE